MMKTTIKLLALAFVLFATACSNDDEYDMLNSLWRNVTQNEARIDDLEKWCAQANTNITSLQTIVNVIESNDVVTSVTPIMEGGVEIGYTITFADHDPITIYHGKDGKDGQNGANGQNGTSPIVGVAKYTDGVYYWTLNGEWLLDENGNKLRVSGEDGKDGKDGEDGVDGADGKDGENGKDGADGQNGTNGQNGITPQLKIENDYWYVSYDNGNTWTQLGKAKGEDGQTGEKGDKGDKGDTGAAGADGQDGDSMFQSVTQDAANVYFTLADGTLITITKGGGGADDGGYIFTITYMPNGGTAEMVVDTVRYGCSYMIKSCSFTYPDYGFVEWNTSADGTGVVYTPTENIVVVKDIILYAQWIEFTPASFSVSNTTQVIFSPGNLQYHPKNGEWRFAPSQLDYIGKGTITPMIYNGWLDLFGWSTRDTYFGVSTSGDYLDYSGSFVDWGTNTIGNDAPNTWRTLNYGEWNYLLNNRPNASSLMGVAQVNGVNGLIFLPDNWTCPDGITFKSGFHDDSSTESYAAYQTFTADQWSKMEAAGAVFLPAAGLRIGSNANGMQYCGFYWSATVGNDSYAYCLYLYSDEAYMKNYYRYGGQSVRLVKDL